ncbi:MAG: D-alanyl-D-alanine carboxypeptidase/D-alanyl-D-alanine-endopeptidase [Desulfococcaceae bacterium]
MTFSRRLQLLVFLLIFVSASPPCAAGRWDGLAAQVGSEDSALVADPSGRILFRKNAEAARLPASTLKVFTALMARHYLGEDFRFRTEFYRRSNGDLLVKGYGDPLLVSEVVVEMAEQVARRVDGFEDLILDATHFGSVAIPGVTATLNPYDAPNAALAVNFNTVQFVRTGNRFVSGESQTPLLPVVLDRLRRSGLRRGRVVLSAENNEALEYAGRLIRHFLVAAGVETKGGVRFGVVQPERDRLVYRFFSPFSPDEVTERLLEFSNNFIANQLFIASGIAAGGPPGTLDKGRAAARRFADEILRMPDIRVDEGSGISRQNRVTAIHMLKILEAFAPHYRRMRREGREWFKTGNLSGVKTRAGYLAGEGGLYRFVVFVNTAGRGTGAAMRAIHRAVPAPRREPKAAGGDG